MGNHVALAAIERLVRENPIGASGAALEAVKNNRYMDDLLLTSNSLDKLKHVAAELIELFLSRGFKLRKWIANCGAKSILSNIPNSDLASSISNIDIGSHPLPEAKALGVRWDVENDQISVRFGKNLSTVATRREMSSQLAGQFDPLGLAAPYFLRGKLIFKCSSGWICWDDKL